MNNAAKRRRRLRFFGIFLGAFVLGGCASDGAAPPETVHQPAADAARAPQTAALPAPSAAPTRTARAAPEPEIDAPAPKDVIGWSTDALNAAFGAASLVRRDLGAEIWQYRTDQCVLLLFLYPRNGSDGPPLQVDHLDVGNGNDAGTCLKSVVRRHVLRTTG